MNISNSSQLGPSVEDWVLVNNITMNDSGEEEQKWCSCWKIKSTLWSD